MLSKLNDWTIPMADSKTLEEALKRTKNRQLAAKIEAELKSRKVAGVNRPMRLEDMLG